ncbi:MAG: hypothetical protein ACK4VI_08025 [Alphaproteobacteria bacterium]
MDNLKGLIDAMTAFCRPEAQERRLRQKWSAATAIRTLHIQYNDPAPDGDFEILFVTDSELIKRRDMYSHDGTLTEISFAAGVALAREENCCGGSHTLQEAKTIASIHPEAIAQNEKYALGL